MSIHGDVFFGDSDMEENNERWRERLSQYIDFVTSHDYNPSYLAHASPDTKMQLVEKHGLTEEECKKVCVHWVVGRQSVQQAR